MPFINDYFFEKSKTLAVSGHRRLPENFDKNLVKKALLNQIENGYNTFLIGMAVGFDTLCFNILLELKGDYDIKIVACVPCENQDVNFSLAQKLEYKKLISLADELVVLQKEYTKNCMLKRNRFMVDNCSLLLAYATEKTGGTAYTIKYAKNNQVKVIEINM